MRKELRKLRKFAKKIIPKRTYKKIKKLKNKDEKKEIFEHLIRVNLDHKYKEIKEKIKKLKEGRREIFFVEIKAHLLHSKIQFFKSTLYKEDFKKMIKLFKEVEKELKNV